MIPYNISEHSIVFFAKGRPWEVASDNIAFDEIATLLTGGSTDIDKLCELADTRVQFMAKGLEFVGDAVTYNGNELHNVWVDKIMLFHDKGASFDPVFKALDNLLTNPTPAAIERLPAFVEESKLGFLADGRIACFKYVRSDFKDAHTGTVDWSPGQTVTIDRSACEADPNITCAAGLHVGALSYIKRYGFSGDKRIVLCAVWPADFVAVPYDYADGKARVCRAEVLEELDKKFVDEFLNQNKALVVDNRPDWLKANIGDYVEIGIGSLTYNPGIYKVVGFSNYPNCRLELQNSGGATNYAVNNNAVKAIVPKPHTYMTAKVGDTIRVEKYIYAFDSSYDDDYDTVTVRFIDQDPNSNTRLKCADSFGTLEWVDNEDVVDD